MAWPPTTARPPRRSASRERARGRWACAALAESRESTVGRPTSRDRARRRVSAVASARPQRGCATRRRSGPASGAAWRARRASGRADAGPTSTVRLERHVPAAFWPATPPASASPRSALLAFGAHARATATSSRCGARVPCGPRVRASLAAVTTGASGSPCAPVAGDHAHRATIAGRLSGGLDVAWRRAGREPRWREPDADLARGGRRRRRGYSEHLASRRLARTSRMTASSIVAGRETRGAGARPRQLHGAAGRAGVADVAQRPLSLRPPRRRGRRYTRGAGSSAGSRAGDDARDGGKPRPLGSAAARSLQCRQRAGRLRPTT